MADLIEIKAGAKRASLAQAGLLAYWENKKNSFLANLCATHFKAIIFDFDGTVYDGGQLHGAIPDNDMLALLNNLLNHGIKLGFASGRGLSLRDSLRAAFAENFWPQIYVAYQDGAEVGQLTDNSLPTPYSPDLENPQIAQIRKKLEQIFAGWLNPPVLRAENQLLGLRADFQSASHVFEVCSGLALAHGLKVFKSGRMVDVTPPQVSKRNLDAHLAYQDAAILAIGDAGAWPGNDCELLASPYGLSVGTVSAEPDCCWRITENTGIEGTREILKRLLPIENGPALHFVWA